MDTRQDGNPDLHLEYLVFMFPRRLLFLILLVLPSFSPRAFGQDHKPSPPAPKMESAEEATVARGKSDFKSSCGFCHGEDATGSRAPDLVRSAILNHDVDGNLIAPVIKNGRPDKGMPAFSTLKDSQIADIVAFLHHQAFAALNSANVPGDYPLAKMLTGNADAGKAYFEGAGGCSGCHSATKDLAGVAKKYSPVDLQQQFVYPSGRHETDPRTAVVITAGRAALRR